MAETQTLTPQQLETKLVSVVSRDKQEQQAPAQLMLLNYVTEITDQKMPTGGDVVANVKAQIAAIDQQIGDGLDKILHDPDFKALEASWRGLRYLVTSTETSSRLKLRVLPLKDKAELHKDLRAGEPGFDDQSATFKKVYEEEYGTHGGNPFSLLIGDFEFSGVAQDVQLLNGIAKVASAAHTPFIAAASPELFGMSSYEELSRPRDLAKIFESTEAAEWRSFREKEDSRYVTLVLPRFLLRVPYGDPADGLLPVDGFTYGEGIGPAKPVYVTGPDGKPAPKKDDKGNPVYAKSKSDKTIYDIDSNHKNYLWGNAAYALGARITAAFARYSWCAAIRGYEGGGLVSDLPVHLYETSEGKKAMKCPTEVAITDRREKELDSLGFVSLVHRKGTNSAVFFGSQTTQKPKKYDLPAATANARISARLPYLLAASRFAHYLKVICRDKVGTFQTKETLGVFLNRWISDYVLGTDDAGQETKAQFPLREARIDVKDQPGNPGAFSAVAFLRPHFQLEELSTSIRLVAELPPPAAG